MTDQDQIIEQLRRELEAVTHERDALSVAIAEHVEALGGEGNDATALEDSRHQLERLIAGEDLDCGIEHEGIAGQVEALTWLRSTSARDSHAHANGDKFALYLDRLPSLNPRKMPGFSFTYALDSCTFDARTFFQARLNCATDTTWDTTEGAQTKLDTLRADGWIASIAGDGRRVVGYKK